MSELVTKPIAVAELRVSQELNPPCETDLLRFESRQRSNYAFGSVPGGVDGIHWLIDGSVRPFGPSSF